MINANLKIRKLIKKFNFSNNFFIENPFFSMNNFKFNYNFNYYIPNKYFIHIFTYFTS